MSSLDPKDAIADYSSLNETQMKTLDQWDSFFAKVSCRRDRHPRRGDDGYDPFPPFTSSEPASTVTADSA